MNSTIEYYNNNSNEFIENTINLNMSDLYKKFVHISTQEIRSWIWDVEVEETADTLR